MKAVGAALRVAGGYAPDRRVPTVCSSPQSTWRDELPLAVLRLREVIQSD